MHRRDFVHGLAAGLGIGAAPRLLRAAAAPASRPLKLLILGGTGFLGPHTVEYALKRGHEITLFNRGRTNADMYPDLEKLTGDRFGDLSALEGRDWDVCLDNSGYIPATVEASAGLLSKHVKQYVFISSISVFADFTRKGLDEDAPVGVITDEEIAGWDRSPKRLFLCLIVQPYVLMQALPDGKAAH